MKWVIIYSKISLILFCISCAGFYAIVPKDMDLSKTGASYDIAEAIFSLASINLIGLFIAGIYLLVKQKKSLGITSIAVPVLFFCYVYYGMSHVV